MLVLLVFFRGYFSCFESSNKKWKFSVSILRGQRSTLVDSGNAGCALLCPNLSSYYYFIVFFRWQRVKSSKILAGSASQLPPFPLQNFSSLFSKNFLPNQLFCLLFFYVIFFLKSCNFFFRNRNKISSTDCVPTVEQTLANVGRRI